MNRATLGISWTLLIMVLVTKWGYIPTGIRSVELLLKPVLNKEIINRYAGIYKEDPLFVIALIKMESRFVRRAKSRKGAVGLMQIMPGTAGDVAQELGIQPFNENDLENPETNIRFGFHHLSKLRKEFGDDDTTVLAAYNAGQANVTLWLEKSGRSVLRPEDIEFAETRNYVQQVTATYQRLKQIQKWRNRLMQIYQ